MDDIQEDLAICTRCKSKVEDNTLVSFGSWKLCEICVDDI